MKLVAVFFAIGFILAGCASNMFSETRGSRYSRSEGRNLARAVSLGLATDK